MYEEQSTVEKFIPVRVGDHVIRVATRTVEVDPGGDEVPIVARTPSLDEVLGGVKEFGQRFIDQLSELEVSSVTVEFGCEFAVETGTFIAVVGKASATSTVKVVLEWSGRR